MDILWVCIPHTILIFCGPRDLVKQHAGRPVTNTALSDVRFNRAAQRQSVIMSGTSGPGPDTNHEPCSVVTASWVRMEEMEMDMDMRVLRLRPLGYLSQQATARRGALLASAQAFHSSEPAGGFPSRSARRTGVRPRRPDKRAAAGMGHVTGTGLGVDWGRSRWERADIPTRRMLGEE